MKKNNLWCLVVAVVGLGVCGCEREFEYDTTQIYTVRKEACETSIVRVKNSEFLDSPESYIANFEYEEGKCFCDNELCDFGKVCNDSGFSINYPNCINYICTDGKYKCIKKDDVYVRYKCDGNEWKFENVCYEHCGEENENDCPQVDPGTVDPNTEDRECTINMCVGDGEESTYLICDNGKWSGEKSKRCSFDCDDKKGCITECKNNDVECLDGKNARRCVKGKWGDAFECETGYCNVNIKQCDKVLSDKTCQQDKCENDEQLQGVFRKCNASEYEDAVFCENNYSCKNENECGECIEGIAMCQQECQDGSKECKEEDKIWMVSECKGGEKVNFKKCELGCAWGENGEGMCAECKDYQMKCENDKLYSCNHGRWYERGTEGFNDYTGAKDVCVCKSNEELNGDKVVDNFNQDDNVKKLCRPCYNDTNKVGHQLNGVSKNDNPACEGNASCKADFSGCGECLNGSKMCDKDVSGASVLKTCENGNWNSENCLECKQTDKTNAECVKFGEGCKNECIEDVAYVCIDNVSTQIGCSKGCELNNGVLLCAGCAESHKNGNDFRCVDCIDKSDCGDGYVCEENNCIQTNDSMCQSVSCINDGNRIGELQCSDNRTVKCDNASCNRNVCGECLNGNTRCKDGKLQKCVEGKWGNGMACFSFSICEDNGDGKAKCVGGSGNVCTDGEKKCSYQYDTQNNTGTKIVVIRQNCIQGAWHGATASPNVLCDNSIVIDGESRCVSEINLNGQIVSGVIGYNYNNISGLSFEDCGDLECVEQGSQAECGGCKEDDKRCDGNKLQICKDGKWDGEECGNNKICINPNIKSGNKEAACYNLNNLRCIYRRMIVVDGSERKYGFQAVIQTTNAASYSALSDLYIYDDCTICNLTDSGVLTKEWDGNRMCASGTYEENNNRINMNGVFEECKNEKIIYKACPDNQYCDGRSNSCVSAGIDDPTPDEPVES